MKNIYSKEIMNKKKHMSFINNIRHDLLNMRIAKAQRKTFKKSKYIKKRKLLAKLLTQINK